MVSHLALLKGINVGGRNLVKMADLRELFLGLKFENVSTILQSGNVVFTSAIPSESEIESVLETAFEERFGFKVDLMVRSAFHLKSLIEANPFKDEAKADPSHLLIHFFRQPPNPENLAAVQAAIRGPEKTCPIGKEVYVFYPDGIGTSTVTRTPGWNKLMGGSTARNWNTVVKLAELLD